jgi:hypothetical protein
MRWYEYKMETDDLYAPDDLKAKLLAMTDQLTEEEKAQPMMKTAAPVPAQSAPVQPKKKLIRFPAKRVGALAACLAVCVVGYGAFATGQIGLGAKSSSPAVYYSADSTAAGMAAGGADRAAVDSPMAADYSLNTMALESGADNGTAVYSEDDAAAAAHSTDHAKIIYTANLSLESKDYDAARAALDAALAEAGGYLESSSEYSDAGDSRSVSLTYRVPQQNYENFLAAVAEAGNVTYKNQQADDVTAQYMDVETRLENLKNQRTRLQQLQHPAAGNAGNVGHCHGVGKDERNAADEGQRKHPPPGDQPLDRADHRADRGNVEIALLLFIRVERDRDPEGLLDREDHLHEAEAVEPQLFQRHVLAHLRRIHHGFARDDVDDLLLHVGPHPAVTPCLPFRTALQQFREAPPPGRTISSTGGCSSRR